MAEVPRCGFLFIFFFVSIGATSDVTPPPLLMNTTLVNLITNKLSSVKYTPVTSDTFKNEYDYIIVGAGSAGSTLAARLSEVEDVNVLLLEAGPDPPAISEVPMLFGSLLRTDIDWSYQSVPQKHAGAGLNNRSIYLAAGKSLGGSSSINAMMFVRGNKKNFDDWAEAGATGWSYEEVLPYFKKLENNTNPEFVNNFGGEGYHGFSGPVTVSRPPYNSELMRAALEAATELGYPILDVNGKNQKGFYPIQATIRDGRRCSTAKAYLVEADDRDNLDIVKNAFVTKVIIENKRAVGVEFFYPGNSTEKFTVKARREVIVSAGVMNTPKLLMLSGVGPKEELDKHKIPVVADLPVGLNLQDHQSTVLGYHLSEKILPAQQKTLLDVPEYLVNSSGILASPGAVAVLAFLSKHPNATDSDLPDYQLSIIEAPASLIGAFFNVKDEIFEKTYAPHEGESTTFCFSQLLNPKSRGTVTLRSADPRDPPLVDPNYFSDPGDVDNVLQAMKKCNEIAETDAMKKIGVRKWTTKISICEEYELDSDEYLACQLRSLLASQYHLVGTAKMGSVDDPTTVVDPKLRVKGVNGLRIVDASVMPLVTSGNTNIPVIMIAEKAADMIKESIRTR